MVGIGPFNYSSLLMKVIGYLLPFCFVDLKFNDIQKKEKLVTILLCLELFVTCMQQDMTFGEK